MRKVGNGSRRCDHRADERQSLTRATLAELSGSEAYAIPLKPGVSESAVEAMMGKAKDTGVPAKGRSNDRAGAGVLIREPVPSYGSVESLLSQSGPLNKVSAVHTKPCRCWLWVPTPSLGIILLSLGRGRPTSDAVARMPYGHAAGKVAIRTIGSK